MGLHNTIVEPTLKAVEPLIKMAPRFLASLALIIVGLILAYLAKRLVKFLSKVLNFDVLSYRIGLTSLISRVWFDQTPTDIIGRIVYWFVLFLSLLLGVLVLHVETLNVMITELIAYIPLLVVSLLIFAIGYFISRFLGRAALIALVNSQYRSANLIAFLVRCIILIFFIAVAVDHIGIGRGIVVATFAIILGGIVFGLAIAFGIGGRDIAKEMLEKKLKSLEKREKYTDDISHL